MSDKRSILVVEDDENITELIRYHLEQQGYRVSCLGSGEKVLLAAGMERPDLILLDIMLPGIDGLAVLRRREAGEAPGAGEELLAAHGLSIDPGWVFSRERIVEAVRGEEYHVTDRAVDVTIFGLRKKLGPAGVLIETVRGVGYRFRE